MSSDGPPDGRWIKCHDGRWVRIPDETTPLEEYNIKRACSLCGRRVGKWWGCTCGSSDAGSWDGK